jgi:predicted DCC family thiol-disulfide oxidoreductase YuxK
MEEERRMASWHLVREDGAVHSAGDAVAPLMRLLPGGLPLAALFATLPGTTERLYALVARNRGLLGRVIPRAAVARAERRIDERSEAQEG